MMDLQVNCSILYYDSFHDNSKGKSRPKGGYNLFVIVCDMCMLGTLVMAGCMPSVKLMLLCINSYYRVKADMFGWYGNSDIRDNNGELPSHIVPPEVEYITFDDYEMQHNNIIRHSDITNLTYNVTLIVPMLTTTEPTSPPQPFCVNNTVFYGVVSILAAFSFILLVALIVFLCHRSHHKVKQPRYITFLIVFVDISAS